MREPGISVCPRCGALHGSDAHFCPSCGAPFQGPRAIAGIGEGVSTTVGEIGTVEPTAPAQIGPPAPEPYATEPLWAQPQRETGDGAEPPTTVHQPAEASTDVHEPAEGEPEVHPPDGGGEPVTEAHPPDGGSEPPTEVSPPGGEDGGANGDAGGRSEPAAGERSDT